MYNVSDKFKEHVKNNGYIEKRAKSAKEPVAKLKWSDFELEPLKPNLIKNGWEGFEPYGSGKNYVTSRKGNAYFVETIEAGTAVYFLYIGEGKGDFCVFSDQDGRQLHELWFGASTKTHIPNLWVGKRIIDRDITRIHVARNVPEDLIVTTEDNLYLYKDIVDLGGGKSHIRTWGGTSKTKLFGVSSAVDLGTTLSYSFYLKVNQRLTLSFNRTTIPSQSLESGFENFVLVSGKQNHETNRTAQLAVRANEVNDGLDFIASDPVIVEGDEPNPVLIVDDLGNGKSKVRVFGANENTKLVHRGTKGIKGEPYTVKTNIDNKGNQLQLDTNLDEQSETIKKGNNDVKLEGKLKDNNIEIKLGRG